MWHTWTVLCTFLLFLLVFVFNVLLCVSIKAKIEIIIKRIRSQNQYPIIVQNLLMEPESKTPTHPLFTPTQAASS